MKTLKATTARILLLCLIFIEQNVAEPTARHNVVSHHQDTARRHHAPSGIQAPHKLTSSSSKVYCISADSNIYEILHKANAYCRGNDFKCTFYHYSDHKYHNLGTIDVNRELFDKLLAKYDNWLMTSEPIEENNGKDSNHKVRLKGSGNKLYSTYIIDEKTPDKANRNGYDCNVMQDTTKLDKHYRRHKAKLTGDQKTRYINGERVSVDPKFNKQQKYYEVFLPKDKHRGDPRTIYVDIDGDKENTDKELNNDLNDKPIKVQLNEYSSNEEGKFSVHDKHNRKDVYRQHSNNKIARIEDIEETNKYQSPVALNTKLGDNDKMLSDFNNTDDENTEDDDDKLHRIHLVETNKHHNDLSADNFTYKRTNTVQLNEPVFHVENPRNRNNMHIFSLPDYTGHHSDIISDYTGYKDIHLLPNLPDDEDVLSLPSNYDISLSEATEKESPITLYTNPYLQTANDNLLPGRINYFAPKVTHGTPFSSQSGSSPIVSSSSETAAIPKYSPFDIALRSSPYSRGPETLTPCDLKTLSQGTISSSPSAVLSNEEKYKIDLLSPFEATKSFENSNLFKTLPSVNPETTYFSQPLDVTMPVDATSFLNNLPKSFESVASYPSTATMPSPLNSKLGPEICQLPQMPYTNPYSQFSPPNLGLLNQLQQNNNFAKPMFNQNNMFSQPPRDIFDVKINPFFTRPPFSYPYAEPFNPMASYLSSAGSVINSSPSAYTNSILNGNRQPGTVSNSFLHPSPVNQMSPLNLRQQRPNYYSPPCPKAVGTSPYNNVSPMNLEKYHQFTDQLDLNANLKVQDSLSPIQNIPLSVLDHPYRTTPSNYIRPSQANIFSSSTPNQAKPIILNSLENQFIESQGETSSYSELAHITEKPCLNVQNEPLVTFDASLLGDHLFELSPTKPIVSNTDVNISDGSIDSEHNKLTPIDFSLADSDSDTIHIQLNTTVTLNQDPQHKDEFNLSEDSNLIQDSSLTEQDIAISPCTAVDNNKPSINVTTTINIESEPTLNDEAGIPEFDSSLIGTDLPISSEDSIVTEFDTENLTKDPILTDFVQLEQSDKNVERELNQTVNIKQESNQTDIEYSDIDEPIKNLPPNFTKQELERDIADLEPLDSTLIDLESDNITETVAQKFETVDGLPNVNVTVCEPDVNLSVQTNIDLKPEAENPQLLETPAGSTIDITINTSVNITDNVLEPELVETKPNEKPIITNEKTEFIPLDETIHAKDKETINEFEAGEFIPAFTSGMNIPTEDITAEILPNNELNSSLVGPNLDELKEEPGIASTEVNITADLIGPTIFDINETLNDVPSKVVELDSSLIKPISERPTIPPCMEPLEVLVQSDIENLLHSGAIKESDILLSSNPLTFEHSLIGPSLINDTTRLETPPPEKLKEILLTSESPINFESNLLGPNLLPHDNIKDSFENIESSLVGPGLDQILNAPEEISSSDAKLNFKSNLIGPNLIVDANEPDLLRKLEAGTKIDDGIPSPTIVDGKYLVEDLVPYSEYQIDGSLIGPDLNVIAEPKEGKPGLNNNIIAETNEVKPGFDDKNSKILDSSLIDNILDSEKNINGPNGPSIVSSANILSSDLKREGLLLEADISLICPNPPFKPKYEELPSPPPFVPKISFSHDLIGPGLSKLNPETSLPSPYITQEGTPIVSNGFLEELKPTPYSKLPDLYLPATPFINAPQHSLPCENLFTPSPLPSSLLNNRFPASVFNLPSNILSDHQSPLYANTIPYSHLTPSSKYSPLHNLPHTPFSNPYLKPEYLQSVKNPLVLNALMNNPHLKDTISYYSPIQPPESFEQIGFPRQPNLQNLPNKYLQALNGIPFNMQPLKSTIPCASQTQNPLSIPEMNWQELENLPVGVQNTPVKPAFKPVKSQAPISNIYSPLQIKESDSLFGLDQQNYHMIESELNSFIQETKHDNKLEKYETLEEPSEPPCEKVKYLQGDNVEKYISEATTFVEPLKVAKEQLNIKATEFTKLEPELNFVDALDAPRILPPKYKPKVQEKVCYEPLNEANNLNDYQLLEPKVDTPIHSIPSGALKNIPKLPSKDQFYPYEMLPEPLALPVKPSSSPMSYAKPQISPLLSPPCLQEYTSLPASEYLPTTNLRPMLTPVSSRPSKTYGSPYLPEYPSATFIDTYNIPVEAQKPASPKPCESYASPYLPTHSNTPLFGTGIPIESPNLPISALPKELPILPAPLKPLSSTPLTPTEFMSPSYYSPTSTTYTDSPFVNQANILTEPLSLLSATSGLPCLRPLPETNPIFRELMKNPQFMKAMNLPMANNIFPWNNANRKPNPFMLQTPNYIPYESTPLNIENLKKNKLFNTAIESNLQKLRDAPTELWATYDKTNSYAYSNENVVPESNLQSVPYTSDTEKYTNLVVNKDLTSIPLEKLSYVTELKPKPDTQSAQITMDSSKKNELSAPTLELNSQKLETALSEVSTTYDAKSNYINTNDSGTKIREDIVPERHLESVPYTLESKENIKVHEAPTSNYTTESKLNHGRPVSYSQVKEAEYYQPIEKVPQASDMEWLPLSSAEYSPNSPSGVSKPCPKLSPFIQSPYLQTLPYLSSYLPTTMKGSPYKSKLDSLPYSSSAYYPATVEEYSELPTTAPFRNYTPLLPMKSNVLENLVPFEAAPYLPTAVSSPFTRLPSPTSYLPSYQSNMTPLPGLQLSPPTAEQLRYVSPITEDLSPIEYTPVQSPIHASLPSKSIKPYPCPSTTSALPIQNVLTLPEASVSYESYSPQPGLKYPSEYQNIIEHLPTPVPLKESPIYYEPASSPRLVKSPNITESLPFTMSPSSEDIIRPASDNLSPINYAPYTPPSEEYTEVSPYLPCKPLMKPISPQPKLHLPVNEYTILPSSSDTQPLETYSSYETKPYVPDISKPCPKTKPDLAKYLPLDVNPYQINDQPYMPVNKVQTPPNFEYISESSPLLKQLLAPPFTGYNSLPFGGNVKLPYLPPTYMPLDMINTLPPTLMNTFIKSELKEIPTPLSVPTNIITSIPKESSTVSDISNLDNYEEYIEPCPLPKPLQSSSLIKPLMTPIEASPELLKEIPTESENDFTAKANSPQYISPNNSLLKQLIGNAYNSPLFLPQNDKQKPSEIDNAKLSTYEPIICNIDETSSPITPIISELPDMKPCDLKAPLFDQYQSLPTEKISPITVTPLSTTTSPLLTSPYQEITPIEYAETLPYTSNVRPTYSSVFNPTNRPSKLNPIAMKYGPKSIVEYMPDNNNICPSEVPSYMEPALVDSTQYAPKTKNVKQIQLDGFPISELFAKAPKILPYNPLSKIELPKKSEYQNIPKDSSDWVLINNDNLAEEKDAKLTPCEYTQTNENPAEAEYLKLAKLLESKTPKTEFEKYSDLIEENQYKELPTNLQDDNVCKNVYKPENIAFNLPQKPQNSATFDNFYANNHIGASPLICLIDPRRESQYPIKPLVTSKLSYSEMNPDITYLDENLSGNIDLPTDSDYNFITPSENLRSVPLPINPIQGSPISLDTKYLDKPKNIYGPNPVEYLPETQYYYPPKDNIDDIKYSGYKTYQLPTQKLAEKSSNIPLETYYPDVPFSTPRPSIPNSYIPTISPETYIPEYETLESHIQPKSNLKVQPQSPIYNNYYPLNEVTVKPDNFDGNNEIKNCIINYINSKGLKDKLYTNNEEITIPIGSIAITKKEPHTAKILPTNNPSIGLKVWQSNVKLIKAELKFKTNEVSVNNFMPILNNLNEYDIQEIRKIIKKYIDDKYGNHIEVNEPYTIDNQYTVIKHLNHNEDDKYNLLWPTYYV